MSFEIALFPGGIVGAGLLLLRTSVAVSVLMLTNLFSQTFGLAQWAGVLAAIGLCAGLQTRTLAGLSLFAPLLSLTAASAPLGQTALHLTTALALALTGPGAFSADARLFGRRTITLRDRDDSIV
jgi:hypothetical protein